jgi:hypothetical protein
MFVDDGVRFDDGSFDALGKAGISWQTVQQVLRTHPQVRQHIGAVLRVTGPVSAGRWIVVALIEEADNEYVVVSARELDHTETAALSRIIKGEPQ